MGRKFLIPVFFFLLSCCASAQKTGFLTGTWEGDLGDDEFLQVTFIQTGDKICGYTWDYMWRNQRNFCKANFSGFYDRAKDRWYLSGTSFIANSGTHVLMEIMFQINREEREPVLEGFCRAVSDGLLQNVSDPEPIRLVRSSYKPDMVTKEMDDCVAANRLPKKIIPQRQDSAKKTIVPKTNPRIPKITKPPVKRPAVVTAKPKKPPVTNVKPVTPMVKKQAVVPPEKIPPKPATTKLPPVKVPVVSQPAVKKKADSMRTIPPVVTQTEKEVLPLRTAGRINKETGRTIVKDKKITLYIYDNAVTDGDSVSIYYNNRLIMDGKRLSEKPIIVELNLDENVRTHTLSMVALNLGSIPPNTALIVFTDSAGKRHELFSRATLNENALLVFEYQPE